MVIFLYNLYICVWQQHGCLTNTVLATKTRLFKYIENFTTKNQKFSAKKSDIFHISAQNIDCGHSLELPRRGSSNEYPQCMFLSRNKKNNVYLYKSKFYYMKVGFKGVKIFMMDPSNSVIKRWWCLVYVQQRGNIYYTQIWNILLRPFSLKSADTRSLFLMKEG